MRNLLPNITCKIQPMDLNIRRNLEVFYSRMFLRKNIMDTEKNKETKIVIKNCFYDVGYIME